jgi:preprotein translocase subunit SecD
MTTMIIEIVSLFGVAALIGWNIDFAAIAGILISVGTGVDHQIIITDETLKGESSQMYDWKKKLKMAFSIIFTSFFTSAAAMVVLYSTGAGLLRGFALTTILGFAIGVFIARPAYAAVIEILLKE